MDGRMQRSISRVLLLIIAILAFLMGTAQPVVPLLANNGQFNIGRSDS